LFSSINQLSLVVIKHSLLFQNINLLLKLSFFFLFEEKYFNH